MSQGISTKKSLEYEQALERLYQISLFRKDKAVNINTPLLNRALESPATAYPSIHIAGTNGKGSVATKVAKALGLSGLKVGLFTSPHLVSFCERISINSELISEDSAACGLKQLFDLSQSLQIKPTFFELVTVLACQYFKEQNIDIGVFEVGLGGKTDATNVIDPILSVITSIGNDHEWILGETLELIAEQKAGIIRKNIPVILGPTVRFDSVEACAKKQNAPLVYVDKVPGNFEDENRAIAKTVLESLKPHYALNKDVIAQAIKTMPPCRFQEIQYKGVSVIIDVAHNSSAIARLLQALAIRFPRKSLHVIFGLAKDKEHLGCLDLLAKKAKRIYLPDCLHPRLTEPRKLATLARDLNYAHAVAIESPEKALLQAYNDAKEADDLIIVCGSFYLMESILPLLQTEA